MCHARFHCLTVTLALCSLLLQSCRSGLHAIIEAPAVRREHPTTDDHVQASGEALSSGTLTVTHTDALFEGMLDGVSSAESVAIWPVLATAPIPETLSLAAVYCVPRSFAGPFTASSGERVLLGQRRGRWQAVLAPSSKRYGCKHMLPVVGLGDIEASLKALQGQDVWSSRSRIHVLSAPHTPSTPYVYVGKLGLLGGSPVQQAQSPTAEWRTGPTLVLRSDTASKVVYHIPSGYCYKGYRLKAGSVIQRARLTLHYVAANNEVEYLRLAAAQNAHTAAPMLGANVGQVVTLDTLEGSVARASFARRENHPLQCMKHVGLVLYGSTKGNKLCCQKSRIAVQVEMLVEKVEEAYFAGDEEQIAKIRREHVKVLPKQATALEETDAKLVASPIVPAAEFFSADCLESLCVLPVPTPVFGAKEWAQYFGEVGEEPCLPLDIGEILDSPCPFWPDKLVKDTHLLVLIPSTVDGKAFTLDLLEVLIQNPRGRGHRTRYFLYDDEVQRSSGDVYSSSSYWVLTTRDVLPGSRSKPYTAQQALVAQQSSHIAHPPYEIPHPLEIATTILSHYVRSGNRLYGGFDDEIFNTSTRCAELLEDAVESQLPVTVCCFCDRGLVFLSGFDEDAAFGISCLRRFGIRNYRPSALLHSFGADEWRQYFGEVGEAPPLPAHIFDTLNSACPFWPGKAVKDTHLLVLIPATVAGEPFSLDLLEVLARHPKGGSRPTGYQLYSSAVQKAFGAQSPARSYWVLMTRDVLSGSRNATYADQQALVTACASETGLSYELPSALEAATVIFSYYVCSGERLYSDSPWTYTRCQELVDDQSPVIVGGFKPEGIDVDYYLHVYFHDYGVATCRRF